MTTSGEDFTKYIPAAWRGYQNLDQIKSLQERASPHIAALIPMLDEAKQLYFDIFPEEKPAAQKASVTDIQRALNLEGYALKVDGDYGQATQNAVKDYQAKHGLKVDGWFGEETMNHLFHRVSK